MKTVKSYLMGVGIYFVWRSAFPYVKAFCYGVKEGWTFASKHDRHPTEEERKQIQMQYHFSEQLKKL